MGKTPGLVWKNTDSYHTRGREPPEAPMGLGAQSSDPPEMQPRASSPCASPPRASPPRASSRRGMLTLRCIFSCTPLCLLSFPLRCLMLEVNISVISK